MSAEEELNYTTEELVMSYFRYYAGKREEDWWAWQEVTDLVMQCPEKEGWDITLALIEHAPSKKALAYVAAGPLEDLMHYHGNLLIDRIEQESRRSVRFRHALTGVWLSKGTSIYERWYNLMEKYGYLEPGVKPPLEDN
jgi:hypothetical protein